MYLLPQCASQSPASGDGNLLGHLCRMQEVNGTEAIRKLAEGSVSFFPIFITDAGYQTFGNVRRDNENFMDFRTVVESAGAIFLGKVIFVNFLFDLFKNYSRIMSLQCKKKYASTLNVNTLINFPIYKGIYPNVNFPL